MIGRRSFLALAAAFGLSACANTALLTPEQSANLSIRDVSVDVSGFTGVTGRNITVSPAQLQQDLTVALRSQLGASQSGTSDLRVSVSSLSLVSPGQALLIGGISTLQGVVEIKNIRTGEVILPATTVYGYADGGYAPGGVIGALAAGTPEEDYARTVASFASDLRIRLFVAQN